MIIIRDFFGVVKGFSRDFLRFLKVRPVVLILFDKKNAQTVIVCARRLSDCWYDEFYQRYYPIYKEPKHYGHQRHKYYADDFPVIIL